MNRLLKSLATVSAVAAVAACGGNSTSPSAAAPAQTVAPAATPQVVTIHETEFKLDPGDLALKAGTITFNLMDEGKFPHDLHIAPKGTTNEVASSQRLTAGGTATFTVTLQAGAYDMWCGVGNHRQQGMQGTINVR